MSKTKYAEGGAKFNKPLDRFKILKPFPPAALNRRELFLKGEEQAKT